MADFLMLTSDGVFTHGIRGVFTVTDRSWDYYEEVLRVELMVQQQENLAAKKKEAESGPFFSLLSRDLIDSEP